MSVKQSGTRPQVSDLRSWGRTRPLDIRHSNQPSGNPPGLGVLVKRAIVVATYFGNYSHSCRRWFPIPDVVAYRRKCIVLFLFSDGRRLSETRQELSECDVEKKKKRLDDCPVRSLRLLLRSCDMLESRLFTYLLLQATVEQVVISGKVVRRVR